MIVRDRTARGFEFVPESDFLFRCAPERAEPAAGSADAVTNRCLPLVARDAALPPNFACAAGFDRIRSQWRVFSWMPFGSDEREAIGKGFTGIRNRSTFRASASAAPLVRE